jgi:hypothetical protein
MDMRGQPRHALLLDDHGAGASKAYWGATRQHAGMRWRILRHGGVWFEIKDGHYTNLMITRPFFWGNNQEVFKLLAFLQRTG